MIGNSLPRFLPPLRKKERAAIRALFCCLLANLGLATASVAASPFPPQDFAAFQAAPEDARVHILISLSKTGHADEAAALLKAYPLTGPHAASRAAFINGLVLEAHGDLPGAAKTYRAILAAEPKLTLVRSELAQVLATIGEDDSAKHHLQLLEADAPDAVQAAGIQSFIDRIDEKRPVTFSGYVSLAPTTNFNNGSSHTTVYSPLFGVDLAIDKTGRKTSGIGVSAGGSVGYSKRLSDEFQAVTAANVDGLFYSDASYDTLSFSESAELRRLFSGGYLSGGMVGNQVASVNDRQINFYGYGPRLAVTTLLSPRNQFKASSVLEFRDYNNANWQNGTASLSTVAVTHAFDASFTTTLLGGFDKVDTQTKPSSYHAYTVGFEVYKEMPLGITVDVDARARIATYDAMNMVALDTRQDHRYIGSVTLTKRDLNLFGFAPSLNYTYTRNVSNIAIYDYDSHAVDFRLTKDF